MSESEPPMTHRNSEIPSKPEGPHIPGQVHQKPGYGVSDGRCKGGMSQSQAPIQNTGACRLDGKGNSQAATTARENTNARHRGGVARSSDDPAVTGGERRGCVATSDSGANLAREEPRRSGRLFEISKREVWEAFKRVKANKGAAGIDGKTLEVFEANIKGNLYKVWNRMRSGSYFPPSVRSVEIPKKSGGVRTLGIPTVADRVAQSVIKARVERVLEPLFDQDSYGYRPNRSALQAVGATRKRCWKFDWIVEFDIKAAFDNLDHTYLMALVRRHVSCRWTILYIERWLKVGGLQTDGLTAQREKGTPQGGIISPLLMNLFMHYTFDRWMREEFPDCEFARYADDAVVHCRNGKRAELVLESIQKRLERCRLQMHPEKSRIVYCKDSKRRLDYPNKSFEFLGYSFRPRKIRRKDGSIATSFTPAVTAQARCKIKASIRSWRIHRRTDLELRDIAKRINAIVRGWYLYYGYYRRSEMNEITYLLDRKLAHWARRKYRKLARRKRASGQLIRRVKHACPNLFAHWAYNRNRTAVAMGAV